MMCYRRGDNLAGIIRSWEQKRKTRKQINEDGKHKGERITKEELENEGR